MTQLDPQAQSLLKAMKASGLPPVFTLPVPDARRVRRSQLVVDPPSVEMVKVEDDLAKRSITSPMPSAEGSHEGGRCANAAIGGH